MLPLPLLCHPVIFPLLEVGIQHGYFYSFCKSTYQVHRTEDPIMSPKGGFLNQSFYFKRSKPGNQKQAAKVQSRIRQTQLSGHGTMIKKKQGTHKEDTLDCSPRRQDNLDRRKGTRWLNARGRDRQLDTGGTH